MRVRPLTLADTGDALALYLDLTAGPKEVFAGDYERVLSHPGTTIYGAEVDGRIRSMLTLHLLPNVTWVGRPYGLVENVITDAGYRKKGLGKTVMLHALGEAQAAGAYKVMLMTGVQRAATGFYEACGFESTGKIGFQIRWPEGP